LLSANKNSIIAIHGLDASAPQTWEYRYDERDGEKVVNWLSDIAMLPVAVPNARIFTYNWHAEFFKDAVDLTLSNHAEGLLLDIRVLREEVKRKFIVAIVLLTMRLGT